MKNVTEKLHYILLLLAMLVTGTSAAMADIVTGTVVDDTGEPLIGVTVQEKGNTNNGVATGFDGDFSLNVKSLKATPARVVCRHEVAGSSPQRAQPCHRHSPE